MKIKSEAAELSRYGNDALEGFYTAVDNGQARLAMTILADIISAFAEKIDSLEESLNSQDSKQDVNPVKEEKELVENIKVETKVKTSVKETVSKDTISE